MEEKDLKEILDAVEGGCRSLIALCEQAGIRALVIIDPMEVGRDAFFVMRDQYGSLTQHVGMAARTAAFLEWSDSLASDDGDDGNGDGGAEDGAKG